MADELYLRIKENEASFEEIADQFPEVIDQKSKIKIGPVSFNEVEASIRSLIKVGKKVKYGNQNYLMIYGSYLGWTISCVRNLIKI